MINHGDIEILHNPYPPALGTWRPLLPGERRVTPSGMPIAPAFTDVYVNMDKSMSLEAVAKDSKSRTVPFYTKKHKARATITKFRRVDRWESAYPLIMARVKKHLPRVEEAKVMYLIDKTRFRVGGEGDTKADVQAYGATTLRPEHVSIDKDTVKFSFIGKKGVKLTKIVKDSVLASIIHERLLKSRLFETTESRVLRYLRTLPRAKEFKVSDIRPFYGTKMAKELVASMPIPGTWKEYKQYKKSIATTISEDLGNTPSVALNSYIDPRVWQEWEKNLPPVIKKKPKKKK